MELKDLLHAPATFTARQEKPVPIEWDAEPVRIWFEK
jgi:hypothetical protein